MRWWLFLLLIPITAGCLSDGKETVDYGNVARSVEEAALPFLSQTHGGGAGVHDDASLHAASMNIEVVGYHNGVDNSGDPDRIAARTYYTELAVWDDYVFLARGSAGAGVGPDGVVPQQGGFVIIDVRDPASPRYVSEFNALTGSDIEISADGDLAFFGTQRNTIEEIFGNVEQTEDPNSGAPRGIHVVDISIKAEPKELLFHPFPLNGPHTLTYHQHGGRDLLIVQTYDFYANTVPVAGAGGVGGALGGPAGGVFPASQRVSVFEVVRPESGDIALVQVAHFQIAENAPEGRLYFPHDVTVQVHPLRGQTYMYVAYWDKGVRIVDITDLPDPTTQAAVSPLLAETGAFTEFSPSALDAIHLAKPFDTLIDGRHITVAEPEIIQAADETGYITFIDTSTPSRPQKACPTSYWTLPGELGVQNLDFSPHNFDTFDGKVALAHNHAGLWIIDVHNEGNLCEPKSVGFFMDVRQRQETPRAQPYIWGVFEKGGLLYASDESSGLYVLRYTGP